MIWDEFLRHFRFCDEENSGLSDEEQERKGPKNRPKHTRKRIHQVKKNFLEKFKTASDSVRNAIQGVMEARCIDEITDCKKLVGYDFVYRIRIGSYRAFFTFHVHIENDVVMFEYLLPRGEAYDKKNQEKLRRIDE